MHRCGACWKFTNTDGPSEQRTAGDTNDFSEHQSDGDADANGMLEGDFEPIDDGSSKTKHTREKLDEFIGHYNKQYGTAFSTKDSKAFENYLKDIVWSMPP